MNSVPTTGVQAVAPFTSVDSLLETAHRSRTKHPSHVRGFENDHVVELQLVVAALHRTNYPYVPDSLGRLVDFFHEQRNMQLLPTGTNQIKGQEVRSYIANPYRYAINSHIWMIAQKWIQLRTQLLGFERFKRGMDALLLL